jgi:exosortase/archaeosortase family protein
MACTGFQSIALVRGIIIATRPERSLWEGWAKANRRHVERLIERSGGIYRLRLRMIRTTLDTLLNRSSKMRILLAVLVTAPVIYFLNLIRNAAVVYVTQEGFLPFDIFHDWIMRVWSFMVLVILILVVFDLLPELQENLFGLLDILTKRGKLVARDGFLVPRDEE